MNGRPSVEGPKASRDVVGVTPRPVVHGAEVNEAGRPLPTGIFVHTLHNHSQSRRVVVDVNDDPKTEAAS